MFRRKSKRRRWRPTPLSLLLAVVLVCFLFQVSRYLTALSEVIQNAESLLDSSVDATFVRQCTLQEAEYQAEYLKATKIRGCGPSDNLYIRLVQLAMSSTLPRVFLDIGCNKGYSAVKWFSLWNPELAFNPRRWAIILRNTSTRDDVTECGVCTDCRENIQPVADLSWRICGRESPITGDIAKRASQAAAVDVVCRYRSRRNTPIRVFSFDGNQHLVSALNTAKRANTKLPQPARTRRYLEAYVEDKPEVVVDEHWSIELGAFSDSTSEGRTTEFYQKGELGAMYDEKEHWKLKEKHPERFGFNVPVLTVDEVVRRNDLSHVDLIKIDTEGHDHFVLKGAQELLRRRGATVVIFEFNQYWPVEVFKNYNSFLEGFLAENLEAFGYVCYMEGKNLLLRMSYCWQPAMKELHLWSNVWCVQSGNEEGNAIINAFDQYSLAFN